MRITSGLISKFVSLDSISVYYPTFAPGRDSSSSRALKGKVGKGKGEVKLWFVRVTGATATFSIKDGGINADVPWCVLPIARATITIHHQCAFSSLLDDCLLDEIKVR